MKYYLGLDSGGTRTRFVIINEVGDILGQHIADTIHIHQVGTVETKRLFLYSLNVVSDLAKISLQDISHAFLGFAGYGEVEQDRVFIDQMVKDILPNATCGNDVHVAWAGSLAAQAGIQIVGGTGSIVFARNEKGEETRCGGWGYFFGDEGSAYWLSQLMLNIFSKQSDGRIKEEALLKIVRKHFNLSGDFEMIGYYLDKLLNNRTQIAALAPLLFQAAKEGDSSALEAIQKCAYEQAITIHTAMKKLEWKNDKIMVSYSGGLFEAGDILLNPLQQELTKLDLRLQLQKPILSPLLGSAYYAYVLDQKKHNDDLILKLSKHEV